MLIGTVVFNLWLYRLELSAKIDPNDNTFQFALVDRTNQIFDFAQQKCSGITKPFCMAFYLVDHWVPNWAEGYNLPYYYSHIPQVAIVVSWRVLHLFLPALTLFSYYHIVTYLLLSLFPLSVFLALRVIGLSWMPAGVGAVFATHLSTDGLYGIDPPSFLWRGYGLSSQLFAMIWFPLAIAYAYRYLMNLGAFGRAPSKNTLPEGSLLTGSVFGAIVFLTATTAGHLGIGMMAFLTIAMLALAPSLRAALDADWKGVISPLLPTGKRLVLLFGCTGLILAYWIVPILLHGDYHNISFWDPVWKFDSYGARDTIIRLLNGELFDFGRLPVLTYIILFATLVSLPTPYYPFSLLFVFWILFYFGRTTWGGLIDLIPGMREFHLSRFIVGVQMAGLFLLPLGLEQLASRVTSYVTRTLKLKFSILSVVLALLVILISFVYPQTVRYAAHNDTLIRQANENFANAEKDTTLLLSTLNQELSTNPGRVFAGRGGSWGRNFRVAETPYYMHLSTYGIPTVLWLPETWSPNSDIEQYFSEDQPRDYVLYNIRYVVAPPDQPSQPFWKKMKETSSWILYSVDTDGYITTGVSPAIVSTTKETFINVIRLWIQSDYHKRGLYPQLVFDPTFPKKVGLPNFRMTDEATYRVPGGTTHSLLAEIPTYLAPDGCTDGSAKILSQTTTGDMEFAARVEITSSCPRSVVILRQTYHPSWKATVNGNPAETITVFPFYTAILLDKPGTYEVAFTYKPSTLKIVLLFFPLAAIGVTIWLARTHFYRRMA